LSGKWNLPEHFSNKMAVNQLISVKAKLDFSNMLIPREPKNYFLEPVTTDPKGETQFKFKLGNTLALVII